MEIDFMDLNSKPKLSEMEKQHKKGTKNLFFKNIYF